MSLLRATRALWGALPSISPAPQARAFSQVASIPTEAYPEAVPAPATLSTNPTTRALDLLRSQQRHYAVVELLGRPYLVTKNDIVVLSRANDLRVGDSLSLDRVRELGSKDHTLKGDPLLAPGICSVKATVLEHPSSSQMIITKFKKRKNYHRTYRFKAKHTLLRISDISISSP